MLRVGIIGAGSISVEHINPYLKNGNCEIVAIADLNLDLAKKRAAEFGIPNAYADYHDILNDKSIDAISIVTPTFTHKNIVIDAINSGKHILCEKPPALNADDVAECVELAKKSDKLLMYAFVCRFRPQMQYLKKYFDAGKMGKIVTAEGVRIHRCDITKGWFLNKSKAGGGPLIDAHIHELDMIMYLMGYPKVKTVLGFTSDLNKELPLKVQGMSEGWVSSDKNTYTRDVENVAEAMITLENGACIHLKTSTVLCSVTQNTSVEISGEKAGIRMEPHTPGKELMMVECGDDGYFRDIKPAIEDVSPYYGQVDHFVDCCLNGTECVCKPYEAVELMKIIDAIYKSAVINAPITF
jgi:predicted dehydrogenase